MKQSGYIGPMKRIKRVSCIGLLLLFWFGLTGCATMQQIVQKPSVTVTAVRFASISLSEGRLEADLQFYNPNAFALPVRELVYHLKLNGRHLLDGQLAFDKRLAAQASLTIPVTMQFRYRDALDSLNSILQQQQISFEISGQADLQFINVPFSKTGHIRFKY